MGGNVGPSSVDVDAGVQTEYEQHAKEGSQVERPDDDSAASQSLRWMDLVSDWSKCSLRLA